MKKFILLIFSCSFFLASSPILAQTTSVEKSSDIIDLPKLTIISPTENQQIFGAKVIVSFIVNNFIFVDFTKRPKNSPGEGHLHLFLDNENTSSESARQFVKATQITLENLPAGSHKLTLELVKNNHSSYKPRVIESVNFTTQQVENTQTPTLNDKFTKEEEGKKKLAIAKKTSYLYALGLSTIGFLVILGSFLILRRKNQ